MRAIYITATGEIAEGGISTSRPLKAGEAEITINPQEHLVRPSGLTGEFDKFNINNYKVVAGNWTIKTVAEIEVNETAKRIQRKKNIIYAVIDLKTAELIQDYSYNGTSYVLTSEIINRFRNLRSYLTDLADSGGTPADEFPVDIEIGKDSDGNPIFKTINTLAIFKTVALDIWKHIKEKEESGREQRSIVKSYTIESELDSYTDPRG